MSQGPSSIRVLHINNSDRSGGAERILLDLHRSYLGRGITSDVAVAARRTACPNIHVIDNDTYRTRWARAINTIRPTIEQAHASNASLILRRALGSIAEPGRAVNTLRGIDDLDQPGTSHLLSLPAQRPNILHLHNLHGGYFDLRCLPLLSASQPTVVTTHDTWLKAGHCTYSLECMGWLSGCDPCPHLDYPPALRRDGAHENWTVKRHAYAQSSLHLVAPTNWAREQMEASILGEGLVSSRVINYGIDLDVFTPGNQRDERLALDLPQGAFILIFAATGVTNPYKDFALLEQTAAILSDQNLSNRQLLLLFLGGDPSQNRIIGNTEIRAIPFLTDPRDVARYYRASDLYLHAAKAELFGLTTIEAQACGTPVIVTAVDGTPESLLDGQTGLLVEKGNPQAMADAVLRLAEDTQRRGQMAQEGIRFAQKNFDVNLMVTRYLDLYEELLEGFDAP